MTNTSAATCHNTLVVSSPAAGVTVQVVGEDLATGAILTWQGWVAVYPGDVITVNAGAAGQAIYVSGAILAGAPPYPPADGMSALGQLLEEVVTPLPT